jgi:outer membrane protein assembly factor BamB
VFVQGNQLPKAVLLVVGLAAVASGSPGQADAGWRISPEKLNIQAVNSRTLQILDDRAQELRGALWSVDRADLAEIREDNGRAVLEPKSPGTVVVTASLHGETRTREIRIWPADSLMPEGTTTWGMHPIGREIGDLPAVPAPGGQVATFALEQTADGSTYLRGTTDDGIQEWAWLLPEKTRNVELVCGDWLGGALVSASRGDSFTLYVVSGDGQTRWQHAFRGTRTAHAYNVEHLLHVVWQSADGASAAVTGLDGQTGEQRFELAIPASQGQLNGLRPAGAAQVCAAGSVRLPARAATSRVFVNIDGLAYVAFAHGDWSTSAGKCTPGAPVERRDVRVAGEQRLSLWQIHPDGTKRETVIEEIRTEGPMAKPIELTAPTNAIIPDGLGGVLVSVRRTGLQENEGRPQEFVYRVDGDGKLVYRMALPAYDGALKDEMVLGENNRGFATRGALLIAFDVREGKELWRWDAHVRGIEVFAALADGGCAVQTPEALVKVDDATHAAVLVKGHVMMGWNGQMYMKHQ